MSEEPILDKLTEVYTLLCRVGLNKEYYGIMLAKTQNINTWMDIFIAFGTTGSSVSSIFIFTSHVGQIVFGGLSSIATILALAKPILQLNNRVERQSRLFAGHSDNYSNLRILVSRIRRHGSITDELSNMFEAAEARFVELSKDDDPKPNVHVLKQSQDIIVKRHPSESFWYPGNPDNPTVVIYKEGLGRA